MIEIKLSDTTYNIPSSWNDITFNKYVEVVLSAQLPFIKRLSIYTGLEAGLLDKLTVKSIEALSGYVSFLDTPDDVYSFANLYEGKIQIGEETYGKLEQAKQALTKAEKQIQSVAEVIKIYTDEEIGEKPITQVIGQVLYFTEAIKTFLDTYKEMGDWEPTIEEYEAGIEKLSALGAFATATAYARRSHMKTSEVFNLSALEVYTTLLHDYRVSEYEKRLNDVRVRNSKLNNKV